MKKCMGNQIEKQERLRRTGALPGGKVSEGKSGFSQSAAIKIGKYKA